MGFVKDRNKIDELQIVFMNEREVKESAKMDLKKIDLDDEDIVFVDADKK